MELARGSDGGYYNPKAFVTIPKVDLGELLLSQEDQRRSKLDTLKATK